MLAVLTALLIADPAIECRSCEAWNEPRTPEKLAPRTWYVGVKGLSSILIDTGDGLVLLDGGLPQSAPLIVENVEALGFDVSDIAIIGLSHAHFDHAGGIAALQRLTAARVVARAPAAAALANGAPPEDDPQFNSPNGSFPPVEAVDVIEDGWQIRMGVVTLTALATPGHSPGGTSWYWEVDEDGGVAIAYADSLSPVASKGFRYGEGTDELLRRSIGRVAAMPCAVFLAPHPFYFDVGPDGDKTTCKSYARSALEQLERRLIEEAAASGD